MVVAAVLPMFSLPEAGILLVLRIDHILDMGRTVTNVLGNAIATTVVAKSEGAIGAPDLSDEDDTSADSNTGSDTWLVGAGQQVSRPGVPARLPIRRPGLRLPGAV